jgi:hypothetical protein
LPPRSAWCQRPIHPSLSHEPINSQSSTLARGASGSPPFAFTNATCAANSTRRRYSQASSGVKVGKELASALLQRASGGRTSQAAQRGTKNSVRFRAGSCSNQINCAWDAPASDSPDMNVPPQTVYQQLREFFPALHRNQHTIAQYFDDLSIWFHESTDGGTIERFGVEYSGPPAQPPLQLFQTVRGWFEPPLPPIDVLINELTNAGRAAPFTSARRTMGNWMITVSVFPQTRAFRMDRIQPAAAA